MEEEEDSSGPLRASWLEVHRGPPLPRGVGAGLTPLLEEVVEEEAVLEVVVLVDAEVEVEKKAPHEAGHGSVRSTTSDCTRQHIPGPRVGGEAQPSLSWK